MKTKIILDFIDAINKADTDRMFNLMSENHIFIDAHDNKVKGNKNIKQCWIQYFEMFPDYKIEIGEILEKDSLICILGYAGGTYKNLINETNSNYWRIPAAWTATIKNNKI